MMDTTLRWWGPVAWDSPLCQDAPRVPIPIGRLCAYCHTRIESHHSGVSVPDVDSGIYVPWHLECFRDTIGTG